MIAGRESPSVTLTRLEAANCLNGWLSVSGTRSPSSVSEPPQRWEPRTLHEQVQRIHPSMSV